MRRHHQRQTWFGSSYQQHSKTGPDNLSPPDQESCGPLRYLPLSLVAKKSKFIQFNRFSRVGGKHAMALTTDGRVYSWGDGEDGKLGHGSRADCLTPRKIEVNEVCSGIGRWLVPPEARTRVARL